MTDKKTLVRIRAGHKAYVSGLLANLDSARNEPEHHIDMLQATKAKIGSLTDQILALMDTDREVSDEITKENDYVKRINDLIKSLRAGNSSVATVTTEDSSVRLPLISLRRFSGNYEDWLPFWETYEGTIHNCTRLTDVEKFHYLANSLCD